MLKELQEDLLRRFTHEQEASEPSFPAMRGLTAHLLLVAGAGTALEAAGDRRERERNLRDPDPPGSRLAFWAPLVVAPLAAAAHAAHAVNPSRTTTTTTRVLNATVVGLGFAGLVGSVVAGTRPRGRPSLASLALGSMGALGIFLDRQERIADEERRRLERRAAVVERLVPRRRTKLDRVVVHV